MLCPICGTKLEDNTKECLLCGYCVDKNEEKLSDKENGEERYCSVCGAIIDNEKSICPLCGAFVELPAESETLLEEFEEENSVQRKSVKQSKNSKRAIIVIFEITLLFVIGTVLFIMLKDNKTDKNKTNDTSPKSAVESTAKQKKEKKENDNADTKTEDIKPIDANDYLGFWNIHNNTEKELIINDITEDAVNFSLFYYRMDEIRDVDAVLKNNIAHFSSDSDGEVIKGIITLNDNSISVQITQSDRVYMPVEIMIFEERHKQSWQYGNNSSIENSFDGYGESNSYDSVPSQAVPDDSGYILPDSSTRLLDYSDIQYLSPEQLELARNEIYARRGRIFKEFNIKAYFESMPWYSGTIEPENFTEQMLSNTEKANIEFIKSHE